MSVTIHCPHCGAAGNAPDHIIGQSVRCSKCKQSFVAGGEEQPDDLPDERDESEDDFDAPPPPRKGKAKARSSGGGEGGGFGDVLMFRTLIGPTIVVIIFWLGIVSVILGFLAMIAMSFMLGVLAGLGGLVVGLIGIVVGIPFVRLICELMMVQFRIYEKLKEMKGPPG